MMTFPLGTISYIDSYTTSEQFDCDVWQAVVDVPTQDRIVFLYRNKWWYPDT